MSGVRTLADMARKTIASQLREIMDEFAPEGYTFSVDVCGSVLTCEPPPEETDIDIRVFVDCPGHTKMGTLSILVRGFERYRYFVEGAKHYQDMGAYNKFLSLRQSLGRINILLTLDADWYGRHKLATALCKEINELDKTKRIAIFQAILYGRVKGVDVHAPCV